MKAIKAIMSALLAVALFVPEANAQLTASKAFADAPASVFPLLNRNARLDMIDYFNGGMSTASTNALPRQITHHRHSSRRHENRNDRRVVVSALYPADIQ